MFVLANNIYPDKAQTQGAASLQLLCELLRLLVSRGNRAAAKRYVDIQQMCEVLGNPVTADGNRLSSGETSCQETRQELIGGLNQTVPDSDLGDGSHGSIHDVSATVDVQEFDWGQASTVFFGHEPSYQQDHTAILHEFTFGEARNDTIGFGDEDFALTGVIETDWEELSRQIAISMPPSPG